MKMDTITLTDDSGTHEVWMHSYLGVGPQSIRVTRIDPSKRKYTRGRYLSVIDTDLKPTDTDQIVQILNAGDGEFKWKGHFLPHTSGHVIVQQETVILSVCSRGVSLQCMVSLADVRTGLEQE